MDIYKFSEKIPDTASDGEVSEEEFFADREEIDEDFELVITDLRQGVKNPDRVNVFVNNRFSFSLDVTQVVDLGVKKGLTISSEQLEEFKKASEFGKLYQRTLEWVLMRPHSERETRDYLYKKIYDKKLDKSYIDRIIEKLKLKKYLDDQRFAEYYVENRFVKKGVSRKRLSMELMKKGVSSDIISEVLDDGGRDEKEEILKMIKRKRAKYDTDEKLIAYLVRQGFSYSLVREVVESFSMSAEA
ncbi:RecX family transcriptional regulator [Candidatus Saccharibacteria bacterium]|nr:RecX family transcriptional regulator [Candidatus Saccharibacteria bacterium]